MNNSFARREAMNLLNQQKPVIHGSSLSAKLRGGNIPTSFIDKNIMKEHKNIINPIINTYHDENLNQPICRCDQIKDRAYIEVILPNNTMNTNQPAIFDPQPLSNFAFIDKAEEWVISPLRLQIPVGLIPTTQFGFPGTLTGVNTQFAACIAFSGSVFTGVISAIQEDLTTPNKQYINNYQTVADSINNTLTSLHNTIVAGSGSLYGYNALIPPFITYNANNNLYAINAPDIYTSSATGAPQLYFNWSLAESFYNFQSVFYGRDQPNFQDYKMKIQYYGGGDSSTSNKVLLDGPNSFNNITQTGAICSQAYNTLYNWNIFTSIALTSPNIPCDGTILNNLNSSVPYSQNVIADFQVQSVVGYDTQIYIYYTIGSEFRRIDLKGQNALNNFSYNIYWVDRNQDFNLLQLPPKSITSILWLLERKSLSRPNHICSMKD